MENGNDLNATVPMAFKTQSKIDKALEAARSDGYAVVGFAVHPCDGSMMQLNNQGMDAMQFLVFMQTAMRAYMTSLPSDVLENLKTAGEA